MRTNIVIDDHLIQKAMRAMGLKTKRAVVEAGLQLLIDVKAQTGVRRLRGKIKWEASLDEMRANPSSSKSSSSEARDGPSARRSIV